MQLNIMYRKALYVFLSLAIVFANVQNAYSASPSGWSVSPADIIIGAAGNTVTAIKGTGSSALQSTIKHAPSVANVGKNLIKGGGSAALAYAVVGLIGSGVDWVLDPQNNRVKYFDASGSTKYCFSRTGGTSKECYSTAAQAGSLACSYYFGGTYVAFHPTAGNVFECSVSGATRYATGYLQKGQPEEKYIPINTVAAKVISNSSAGHAPSQEVVKTVIVEEVNAGVVDVPLNINAVPVADAPPVDPPWTPDQPVPPFDPSSIIAAIKSVMAAVVNMSGVLGAKIDALMVEMGLQNAETQRVINEGMADVVAANDRTGAKVAEVVAAIEAIEGNTLDGQVINDAVDRVIAEGKTNTADIVAAIEAIEGNTLDGQVINDAVDRVIENDNSNAQSAAEAAEAAEAARTAADAANTAAVTDAIDAQTDAISQTDPDTGEKSLKLPTFCGWAGTVCEYMDWVKGEYQTTIDWFKTEPAPPPAEPVAVIDDVDIGNWQEKANAGYVQFGGQCPTDVNIPINYMGASTNLSISYAPFCQFASMIKPAVILGAWISAMLIISGGRARES